MKTFFMQTKTYNLIALILCAMAFASCSKTDVPKLLEEGKNAFYAADYVKAKEAFEKCAKEDNSQGQFWLAYTTILSNGHYSETDTLAMSKEELEKYAYDLYKKSADQNDADGWWGVAQSYQSGYGVAKDTNKFNEYLDKAVQLNSAFAKAQKGAILMSKGGDENLKKGVALAKESADAGNYNGKSLMGSCYIYGICVEKDVKKGLDMLLECSNHNTPGASSALAKLYFWGLKGAVAEDKAKSFKFAQKGLDGESFWIMSWCYINGYGTEKDERQAAIYAHASANMGYALGETLWGLFCQDGYGTPSEAFDWYMKASQQGDAIATERVGEFLLKGTAGKTDYAMAKKYLQKAASMGEKTAQDLLSEYSLILSDY
jgi:TPR repeat protein